MYWYSCQLWRKNHYRSLPPPPPPSVLNIHVPSNLFLSVTKWLLVSKYWGLIHPLVCSVQSLNCVRLCDLMDCSAPGFPVHHQFLELAQTHVHRVGDAIQPSHSLLSLSPPAFNPSQNQRLFQWFSSSTSGGQSFGASASASVIPMNTQDWSPLGWTGWISLQSKGLSRVFFNTTVQKHQFFGTHLSLQSNPHIHTWPLEKP